jgi:prolyl-tRNA editing enzyme YbaK/EbsC (Cys-tRNA(Pro) deacylase)
VFDHPFVVFEAGTHDESIRIRTGELLSIAEAEVADLVDDPGNGREE